MAVSKSRSTSSRYKTPDYVPAPTLRGALAGHLRERGVSEAAMSRIFGTKGCRTTRLVPAPSEKGNAEHGGGAVSPAPLTLHTCKRYGGFQEQEVGDRAAHGAEDLLWASTLFAQEGDATLLRNAQRCRRCGNALVPMNGFIRSMGESYRQSPRPSKRTQVHAGRDRRRKGAASGVLYGREVIEESSTDGPAIFQAEVTADEDVMEELEAHLQEPEGEGPPVLNVGTAVSRGLGRCEVRSFHPAPKRRSLKERIADLNQTWHAARESSGYDAHSKPSPDSGPVLLSLSLQTPAFFTNDWLRPELSPHAEDLLQAARENEEAHANALAELEKVHQVARPDQLRAWNGLAGFPHSSDQGLSAGSVLVFRTQSLSDSLLEALRHIEHAGIGLRRELGFGAVTVCSPVHARVHEQSDLEHSESSSA